MEIKDIIKRHSNYSYDEILDMYNSSKDRKYISYCFIKYNNLSLPTIYKRKFDVIFLYVFNIQRELDGLKPMNNIDEIFNLMVETEEEDDDDYDTDF